MSTPAGQPHERRATPAPDGGTAGCQQRPALALAAERSLQLLLIAGVLTVIVFVRVQLRLVVLPVIAAVFLATALAPIARWLRRHRWPPALAALTTMGVAAGVLAGGMAAVVPAVAGELDELGASAREGLDEVLTWLTAGPVGLTEGEISQAIDQGLEQLRDSSDLIAGGVISGALLIGELIVGLLLTVILLFFFLKDGDRLWSWLVQLAPAPRRVIYPLVVGQSVNLHPVAILLALTTGTVVAGIVGALLAVPAAGVIWTVASHLRGKPPHEAHPADTPTDGRPTVPPAPASV